MGPGQGEVVLADGTPLRFDWAYEDAASYAWVYDDSHHAAGRTPMQQWFEVAGHAGHDRAWDELEVPQFGAFRRFQCVGPFLYVRATMDPPEEVGRVFGALGRVLAEHGGSVGLWERWCVPRIRDVRARIAAQPDDAPLGLVADDFNYGLHQTFTSVLALFSTVMPIAMMLDAVGLDGRVLAQSVAQGGANASQEIDARIFDLAEAARADGVVTALATEGTPAEALERVHADPRAATFAAALDDPVATHSSRGIGWDFHAPTWGERPESVLALVRAHLAGTAITPAESARRSAAGRAAAIDTALAALPAGQHDQFLRLARASEGYVGVREDRAYWQMVLCGEARLALLRQGRRLAADGRLRDAEDILWLVPPEFAGTEGDLAPTAAQRREEWARVVAQRPPQQIGTPSPEFAPPAAVSPTELRGRAASLGRTTGRARVLRSPDDGDGLEPGDVLVCAMTTPSWTPLFGLVSAVVTESGDATSHPAITAREYGIPAVVSVVDACRLIPDGATVTVDGAAGTVTLDR